MVPERMRAAFPIHVQCCLYVVSTDASPPNVVLKVLDDVELDGRAPVDVFRSTITKRCRVLGFRSSELANWTIFIRNDNETAPSEYLEIPPSYKEWSDSAPTGLSSASFDIASIVPPSVIYLQNNPDPDVKKNDKEYGDLRPDVFLVDFGTIDCAIADAIRHVRNVPTELGSPWLRVDLEYEGCMTLAYEMKHPYPARLSPRTMYEFLRDRMPMPSSQDDFRIIDQFSQVERPFIFTALNSKITPVLFHYVLEAIRPLVARAMTLLLQLSDEVCARHVKTSTKQGGGVLYRCKFPHKIVRGTAIQSLARSDEHRRVPELFTVKVGPRDHGFALFRREGLPVAHAVLKPCFENESILNVYLFLDLVVAGSICMCLYAPTDDKKSPKSPTARCHSQNPKRKLPTMSPIVSYRCKSR
jgi:hypothetical protein